MRFHILASLSVALFWVIWTMLFGVSAGVTTAVISVILINFITYRWKRIRKPGRDYD